MVSFILLGLFSQFFFFHTLLKRMLSVQPLYPINHYYNVLARVMVF